MSISAIPNITHSNLVGRNLPIKKRTDLALSELFTTFECKDPDCQIEFEPTLIAPKEINEQKRILLRAVFACPNCGTWYSVPLFDLGFVANIEAVVLGEIGIYRPTLKIVAR